MATTKFSYQKAMKEIEDIVRKIENEDIDVDELTEMVNEAAGLIKKCKAKLKSTGEALEKTIENIDDQP